VFSIVDFTVTQNTYLTILTPKRLPTVPHIDDAEAVHAEERALVADESIAVWTSVFEVVTDVIEMNSVLRLDSCRPNHAEDSTHELQTSELASRC